MKKFEQVVEVVGYDKEDQGQAHIVELTNDPEATTGVFFKIQSWDPSKEHSELQSIMKMLSQSSKFKLTLEVIDE